MKRALLLCTVAALTAWLVPSRLCARTAVDAPAELALERALGETIRLPLSGRDFPGSKLVQGELLFATYMMAGMGFGQVALEHPDLKARELPLVKECIRKLLSRPVRQFDTDAWRGHDALDRLDDDEQAHGSYLGYLNLLLSLDRLLDPTSEFAPIHDRITAALARRLERSSLLLASYPRAYWPVDNAAVIGSIALHDRAVGSRSHAGLVSRFCRRLDTQWRDPKTGLLRQTEPRGAPRGSGTALASYFLAFADRQLSADLLAATRRSLYGTVMGFGAIREYPRGNHGKADANSGPIIQGFGVSATGFALGAARANRDDELFARLSATVELFGAPQERAGRKRYTAGGTAGNAILFAMFTAPRSLP
jgi:hypothetical protein